MVTREGFIIAINYILNLEKKEIKLTEDLQEFTGDKDFTGFMSIWPGKIVEWLESEMEDSDNYISWWLWDCPEAGKCKKDDSCSVWVNGEKSKPIVIRTSGDLYDFLTREK